MTKDVSIKYGTSRIKNKYEVWTKGNSFTNAVQPIQLANYEVCTGEMGRWYCDRGKHSSNLRSADDVPLLTTCKLSW